MYYSFYQFSIYCKDEGEKDTITYYEHQLTLADLETIVVYCHMVRCFPSS